MRAAYEASTVLTLGARGALAGAPFTLVGRTCIRGRRGVLSNEWGVRFDDGKLTFLAETGGAFILYDEGSLVPGWSALVPGASVETGFVVVERGLATRVAQWGDVEDAPSTYAYADLSSRSGASATIDFGAESPHAEIPRVFVGRKLTLGELGLAPREERRRFLRAPDVSRPKGVDLWLDVGDEGALDGLEGARFRVTGVVSRSMDDGVRWDEYFLHDAGAGFRWLVVTDGHWSLVEAIDPGRVDESESTASLGAAAYEALTEGIARVDWATGELPWEVTIGDTAQVKDFVHGPHILTKEWTPDEVSWSRGSYITPDVIARAFAKRALPKPIGRAANHPR